MVYLAIAPKAAFSAIQLAAGTKCFVWVGSDVISKSEHDRLIASGVEVTRLSYPLANATPEVIADALATFEEHHPGETIWVQHVHLEHSLNES